MNSHMKRTEQALLYLIRNAIYADDLKNEIRQMNLTPEEWTEVYKESNAHGVTGLAFSGTEGLDDPVPPELSMEWFSMVGALMSANQKILLAQTELIDILEKNNISYIILKGTSAAVNYPDPLVRAMGDVDFLIRPSDLERATKLLIENGFTQVTEEHHCHLRFDKYGICLEMHFEINGIPDGSLGEEVRRDLADIMDTNCFTAEYDGTSFKSPDAYAQGIVLLLHMGHHVLGSGIGLRQMCDWAMYINNQLTDEVWEKQLAPYFEKIGVLIFAEYMTEVCVKYLGLPKRRWMKLRDTEIVDTVMAQILSGGDFGRRNVVRQFSGRMLGDSNAETGNVFVRTMKYIKVIAKDKWPVMRKYPILLPWAYVYLPIRYLLQSLTGKRPPLGKVFADAKEGQEFFDQMKIFGTD